MLNSVASFQCSWLTRAILAGGALAGVLVALAVPCPAAEYSTTSRPPFDRIATAVERHFNSLDYYRPGNLISRSDVADALNYLRDIGWNVPGRAALEGRILSDDAFIVQKLRTKEGARFMAQIASLPGGYDRLDRLSAMSGGRKLIDRLIRDRGGAELIEHLATSQGGANLGNMLAHAKTGSNLNKPTGRIYTVEDLVKTLAELYASEQGE